MNNVITIPKGEFVLLPKKEYQELIKKQPKLIRVEKLTPSEKRAVLRSDEELARGEYVTLKQLEHELGGPSSKKR